MSWVSLQNHSDCSFLSGLAKPKQIIRRCVEVGIPAVALTDNGSLSGLPTFLKEKKAVTEDYKKLLDKAENQQVKDEFQAKLDRTKSLKQILGIEWYLSPQKPSLHTKENGKHSRLVTLAKNYEGWKTLLKLSADSNRVENFYKKPRTYLDKVAEKADGNLVAFSGHMGSDLANCIFTNIDLAYNSRSYDEARGLVDPNWKKNLFKLVGKYQEVFGRDNFFISIQAIDRENPVTKIIVGALRFIADKMGVPTVATANSYYPIKQDSHDQWVLVCNSVDATLQDVKQKITQGDYDIGLENFFRSNNYHIPSPEEISVLHTEDEVKNSLLVADMCESYDITAKPSVPQFDCPDGLSSEEFLRQLCRTGFKKRIKGRVEDENKYVERIKQELGIWNTAQILQDYFLIVQDYANQAREEGEFVGPGRGSAGGCLTSFFIGITGIDPILYDLSFARFYNAGRNTKDRVSLPDIDCDFDTATRWKRIEYIRNKYGNGHVAQMGTFSRMMGRSVLKDVLRVHNACSPIDQNRITEFVPDENKISGDLQRMREEGEDPSIIQWALEHNKKELKEWCFVNDKGKLEGPYAKYFYQAIRLEGTKRGMSKHACGVVIADFLIEERIPLVKDKSSDDLITGVEMQRVEDLGGAKFDILGLANLGKLKGVSALLATGRMSL